MEFVLSLSPISAGSKARWVILRPSPKLEAHVGDFEAGRVGWVRLSWVVARLYGCVCVCVCVCVYGRASNSVRPSIC